MTTVDFWVPGVPVPKGSLRHVGNGRLIESAKGLADWRHAIKDAALGRGVWDAHEQFDGPVEVSLWFYLPRPKSHFRATDRTRDLKASAPEWPHRKPDLDKLTRAVLDALTDSGIWKDDALVVDIYAHKYYADDRIPGARVVVSEVPA